MTLIPADFPVYRLLTENAYEFVEQVRDATDTALISIKGIGPKALEEIRVAQDQILSQVPLFELEPESVPEPVVPSAPVSVPQTVRVTVNVGRLYHAGRFYARGDTVVLPVASARVLRAQEHVRY